MKCPNCGGQMGLEDAFCPYCNSPNTMAVQHQSDMARFRREYEQTQNEVIENTSFMQQHGSWLVILVILLAALVGGVILLVNSWDIGYSIREGNVERSMAENQQALDAYLESGDYGKFVGYYESSDMSLDYDNPYQGIERAAYAYVDLLQYIWALHDDSSHLFRPDFSSSTCEFVASDLNRIYTLEQEYSGYVDEYIPLDKKPYLEDIRDRTTAIAKTYFGLTDEEIQDIPNMSKRKLATLIEEGIAQ